MKKEFVMGNGAIALGAMTAGVNLVSGYPGTPSSEIIETVKKYNDGRVYVEWSVNEKAALEVAAAASYAGARTMVTMKQVGLNVASDPLMSLAYVGVKGGMVIVSADDPGPISSQTEQDTRLFASFAKIPVFDPSSPAEAYEMIQDAFEYSEKYKTPVIFRPTTRVDHAYEAVEIPDVFTPKEYDGFEKDSTKWVIFPKLSFKNHRMIELRNPRIGEDFSSYRYNLCEGTGKKAVFAGGISYAYAKEAMKKIDGVKLVKIGTPYPFPKDFALKCLEGVDSVLCFEELHPFIEEELLKLVGEKHLSVKVLGKNTGHVALSGENSAESAYEVISDFVNESELNCVKNDDSQTDLSDIPSLPVRPPVLCAGCPHRASFYAVKQAMKGKEAVFCGDIGCYTLGNAMPLDMVDTCLCMGAGVTMAQGFVHMEPHKKCFAFIGDSTFFASGMTGVVNALYNEADIVICILDNSTTAMTGHQLHPGSGRNMMGNVVEKVDIAKVLEGMGVKKIDTIDPSNLEEAVNVVKESADYKGVSAIIFKMECIALSKPKKKAVINEKCINCKKCIREIGCPAIIMDGENVSIDDNLCTGCGLCGHICPTHAISVESRK